jgi:2-polyprenyl-6-methoxyphenol hydroxylase-like FAD-dependent oxidoreductase
VSGRVLVSGAGVAGPALAYWLQRFGYQAKLDRAGPIPDEIMDTAKNGIALDQ